jgi:hypothetical protein
MYLCTCEKAAENSVLSTTPHSSSTTYLTAADLDHHVVQLLHWRRFKLRSSIVVRPIGYLALYGCPDYLLVCMSLRHTHTHTHTHKRVKRRMKGETCLQIQLWRKGSLLYAGVRGILAGMLAEHETRLWLKHDKNDIIDNMSLGLRSSLAVVFSLIT